MNKLIFAIAVIAALADQVLATKPVANRAYVQSGPDGVSYARCVPDADTGSAGTTRIYGVGRDKDTLVDTYDWYTPRGVTLGWSPLAGKIAVLAMGGKTPAGSAPVELSFYLGGKLLTSYTAEELGQLGVEVSRRRVPLSDGAEFRVIGCEQVPRTNDYDFVIESKGKRLAFDILTGKIRKD